jgi:site-specific DNA recombinase
MTVASIYARKSNDQAGVNADAKSVARQVERARAFAQARGWTISESHVFSDDAVGGAEFESRDGLMRLLKSLRPKPPFTVLVVMHKDRLGREQYETSYYLKKLDQAGVRIVEYLTGRECKLDTPTDRLIESIGDFAATQERHMASLRTRDALKRKVEQGFVAGGITFGYRNVGVFGERLDAAGQPTRQHVTREIAPEEAPTVVHLFELVAQGLGYKRVAKRLNDEGAPAPRPRRTGRRRSWTPSSVRVVLMNPIYRGEVLWGRAKKRGRWGEKLKTYLVQPETTWTRRTDARLRIVSDDLWYAAHQAVAQREAAYRGKLGGRPPGGTDAKYLLSSLAECGSCHGSMVAESRDFKHQGRKRVYVCGQHRERGNTVCANRLAVPMDAADRAVLKAVERDCLQPRIIDAAIERVLGLNQQAAPAHLARRADLERRCHEVEQELARYAEAIASAGPLPSILDQIKAREAEKLRITAELGRLPGACQTIAVERTKLKATLTERLTEWHGLMRRNPVEARHLLTTLLRKRLIFQPKRDTISAYYEFTGEGAISAIIGGSISPELLVTPAGFEPAISTLKGSRPWPG